MTIGENIGSFWDELSGWQKAGVSAVGFLIVFVIVGISWDAVSTRLEVRQYEQQAAKAKAQANIALATAAKIAREKVELERTIAELEAKRDGKVEEYEKAKIDSSNARAEYLRSVREPRGDNPSAEQLCAELAAAGYPCR